MNNIRNTMLISPDAVKGATYLANNVSDKTLGAAIRETQEIHLQSIIGSELLYRLKTLVYNAIEDNLDTIEDNENECYKTLLDDYITPYLEAKIQAVLPLMISYETRNLGVIHASDTNLSAPSMDDVLKLQQRYNTVADRYATTLSKYLCVNKDCYPELEQNCGCLPYVKPQLGKNFVNVGLWLGGDTVCCGC